MFLGFSVSEIFNLLERSDLTALAGDVELNFTTIGLLLPAKTSEIKIHSAVIHDYIMIKLFNCIFYIIKSKYNLPMNS